MHCQAFEKGNVRFAGQWMALASEGVVAYE
jgi:hypothetical protein